MKFIYVVATVCAVFFVAVIVAASSQSDNRDFGLIWAAREGEEKIVQSLLLNTSIDVNAEDFDGKTALHFAAKKGYASIVKLLIENGAEIEKKYQKTGVTPLFFSIGSSQGHEDVVHLLINKYNANVNAEDDFGMKPTHYAIYEGNKNIVKWLIEKNGTDIECKNNYETTPLMIASWKGTLAQFIGYADIVKLLLENGAEINNSIVVNASIRLNMDNETTYNLPIHLDHTSALHFASYAGHENVVRLLIENGANINDDENTPQTHPMYTPLTLASGQGHLSVTELLLENDANINAKSHGGVKALKGYIKEISLLIERGADIGNDTNYNQKLITSAEKGDREEFFYFEPFGSALHLASNAGNENMIQLLLEYGAEVDIKNDIGETPLMLACRKGHQNVVELLIENGGNVNASLFSGRTALTMAISKNHYHIVQILIENDVDIESKTFYYETPLMQASKKGNERIARLLIESGANVNAKDIFGDTALHFAIENGNEDLIKLLLENNANIRLVSKFSGTAIELAETIGSTKIAEILRSYKN